MSKESTSGLADFRASLEHHADPDDAALALAERASLEPSNCPSPSLSACPAAEGLEEAA
ncbi:MAG: hypothetical protein SFU83_04360 [Meiothermus sp.]|nr:hypothetical protein [Meiothermus sp.]